LAEITTRRFHNERQALETEEATRLIEEGNEVARETLGMNIDLARENANLVDTAQERRGAQLRILELEEQQERMALEAVVASRDATDAQKQIASARLELLGSIYQARGQSVMNDTRGPLGDFLADLPTTAARANEALQSVAANGLQSITDGLTDAIMMTRSWGDVFKNVAKQILADLLRIQIQRNIVGPLANAFGGFFGGAGGGPGPGLFGAGGIAARAAGGPVLPGRTYLVGEKGPEIVRMGGRGVVIPNHEIGGGGIVVNQTFAPNFAGNAATKDDMIRFATVVKQDTINTMRGMQRRR
jgi:phage-related minor tail protein